jgi:phosphatidylglycerophosphate synthase
VVLWFCARHWRATRFGAANVVTLGRAALTMLLFAALEAGPAAAWIAVALALVVLLLDGVDGRLARRRGEASAFGARFDMETDALAILALAVLAWQYGKAGPWIVLAGAMRYAFVLASFALPWLARPLPPSRRRQTVCVVQIATLIACLTPPIAPPWSAAIGLAGLAALTASFAIDVAWLARRAAA